MADDNKLKTETLLRKLLNSLNATSSSRPQFDVVMFLIVVVITFATHFDCFSLAGSVLTLDHYLTPSQGISSLHLNHGAINLTFTPKKALKDRTEVVYGEGLAMSSYSLPYLFQSLDTANVGDANHKLSICDAELTSALKYTDIFGHLGSHPNFPPFPLCRSKVSSATSPAKGAPAVINPASTAEGYLYYIPDDYFGLDPSPSNGGAATWVTDDWDASIAVPDSLVKTISSGTL